ncbi:hypothetical protein CFC21_110553 [Triticum aestivum]|uniref:histone acetyltransferase n=2 Tax=Triticum aestivum TaxID=4565 RepID=A0A9R1MP30_WHEAT|nr:probable histone acetyltransferase HAC-like 1 [Triticum aestivum]XP_044440748.1 probable histone acetyltransferase HAC-like 1 [Triticum aestivum]KAF7110448.1 hypothetical protein CFC21_110553 [Triticum aestivum]
MNLGQVSNLSGKTTQMNPGSSHGMPQQQQQRQVALGHPGVDPEFVNLRKNMLQRILDLIIAKRSGSPGMMPNMTNLAKRLEVALFMAHPTKADYYKMFKGPIKEHLAHAFRTISAQGQQRQQMLGQVAPSSNHVTMIPTPGMSQCANGNSVMPYVMDTTTTTGNSSAGSMYNGYQNPSTNTPLNSTTNSLSMATTSESMQQHVNHMIPTPGFSNQQTLLANSEYSSQVGCFNVESNVVPQMQQQQKPFDNNQGFYPVHHLQGHAGSGVYPSTLNGGMDTQRPRMQLIDRNMSSEAFANLSYGSSCNSLSQQQFNAHAPQRTPTSVDPAVSRGLYDTNSSILTARSNQGISDANIMSNSRMNSQFLASESTTKSVQQPPRYHNNADCLNPQDMVSLSTSQLSHEQPLRQPHQLQPNHPDSQLVQNHYVFSPRQQNSQQNQGQDFFGQENRAQDKGHQLGGTVTSFDSKLLKPSVIQNEQDSKSMKNHLNQLRWLLMLKHAEGCQAPKGSCKSQYCVPVQEIVKHFRNCQTKICSYRYCSSSKILSSHYKNCIEKDCSLCSKVKERLRRSSEQAHKHNRDETIVITKQNMVQKITNGAFDEKMDIDLVVVETIDEQQSIPKRAKLRHISPSASKNGILHVPVPGTSPLVLHKPKNKTVPKQEVSARVDEKIGVMRTNVILGALNVIDSNVKQEKLLLDNDMKENVIDLKNITNGRKDVMVSKSGKPKIKGVSLMELFTPEQIKDHTDSLKHWVGQSKAKAGKHQVIEHSENDNICQLCKVEKLYFEPPPIYCSPCGARIKRNASYYTAAATETCHNFCILCYNEARSSTIQVEGNQFPKAKLHKMKNDDETEEGWVMCDKCERWQHQICALFNFKRDDSKEAEYTCPKCYVQEIEHGLRIPLPQSAVLGAKDLPRTVLSDHIEERLFKRLREERHERAIRDGKNFDEVSGADGLVVRVVSSVDKKLEVKPRFFEIFQEDKYPAEFPYKSKAIVLFQKIEGVEVCLFSMYVQEFGAECADPNQRRVYLSYLDSVKFFRPDVKTVSGEALRTYVYHEILIGYLEYCKQRGFTSCYIWACPPLKGEDYILYCHPEIQKTPKSDKLREWYLSMLRKAVKERIVVELTNLYDHFFITTKECKAKVTAARLPYFDGDYWPGAAEDMINQLFLEEDDRKLQKKGKLKKTITKRALRAAGQTDLSGNASKDAILMQKLGETIYPMKEDFIMVHLQHSCSHCSTLMVAGKRWVCHQCKSFYICDSCYDSEQRLEAKERHPSNSRDLHVLHPVDIVGVPEDTKDRDDVLECEFFDTRQAFLSLCQGNHYQYDTLRRAKHSSMMVLYHLHNPTAPAFVTTCNICNNDIEAGQGWRCEECPDFDVCAGCYNKDGGANHRHKLTNHPCVDRNAQNKEARQMRIQQARRMLDLLVHAHKCRTAGCQYPDCRRLKGLFGHATRCQKRAAGGCSLCQRTWSLLQLHARTCKESKCTIPRCRDLKAHLRWTQQQSESRRRAAVNEMMRQRAAEVARS